MVTLIEKFSFIWKNSTQSSSYTKTVSPICFWFQHPRHLSIRAITSASAMPRRIENKIFMRNRVPVSPSTYIVYTYRYMRIHTYIRFPIYFHGRAGPAFAGDIYVHTSGSHRAPRERSGIKLIARRTWIARNPGSPHILSAFLERRQTGLYSI